MKALKTIIVSIIISVFCFAPAFSAEYYCRVVGGQVVDGPFDILKKKSYEGVSVPYALPVNERIERGWFPLDIIEEPGYSPKTQHITATYTANESSVTPVYTVVESYIDNPPAYNPATQYLTYINSVEGKITTRIYTINDYTQDALDDIAARVVVVKKIADAKAVMALSDLADITYAQLDTYVDGTFANLPEAQRTALKKLYRIVLAILKRQNWSE